jgi:hypothetical protein
VRQPVRLAATLVARKSSSVPHASVALPPAGISHATAGCILESETINAHSPAARPAAPGKTTFSSSESCISACLCSTFALDITMGHGAPSVSAKRLQKARGSFERLIHLLSGILGRTAAPSTAPWSMGLPRRQSFWYGSSHAWSHRGRGRWPWVILFQAPTVSCAFVSHSSVNDANQISLLI